MSDGAGTDGDLRALDDRALVERAQHGERVDPDAFAVLYRRHVGRIHAFVYRRCGSREVAEDVTAATFERALRNLHGFRWRAGGFVAWLHRIAANELVDHVRREQRPRHERARRALAELAPPATTEDGYERVERCAGDPQLLAALDRVNPRYQRAVSLRYLAGLDHTEAAAAMGVSKPVLSVTLHRALRALRRELERGEGSA